MGVNAKTYQAHQKGAQADGDVDEDDFGALYFVGRVDVVVDVRCCGVMVAIVPWALLTAVLRWNLCFPEGAWVFFPRQWVCYSCG